MQTLENNLNHQIEGAVLYPQDEGFAEAAACWCVVVQHQPDVIVLPNSVADVQVAVRFAHSQGMKITVQATGHGQPKTCLGGMLLVTSRMNGVTVDAEARTARVQGGAQWKDVIEPTFEIGLAPLSGSSPIVGVVGYLLGGGIGITMRTYGLGIDSVRSFQIVTPDGEIRTASATQNPNLFWSLKGGGGAFGVVTEVEIDLYPSAFVYGGSLMFPYERALEILSAYSAWTQDLPCEATVGATIMNFPPIPMIPEHLQGKAFVIIQGAICANEERAAEILKPMMELEPVMDDFGMIPYTASAMIHKDPTDPMPASGQGALLKRFTPETAATLIDALGDISRSPNLKIDIRHIGSRNAEVQACASSMDALRDANYLLYLLGVPMGPVTMDMIAAQATRVIEAVGDDVYCRGPLSFIGEANIPACRIAECYGNNLDRLKAIKADIDPDNMFANAGIGIS